MAFIYDLTDTWNNAGISFNGIKLNATDTASAVSSKLLDLQISGASKFTVGKTGTVIATGLIESTVGGFKFPDGTVQTTSAAGGGTVTSVSGTGTVSGLTLTGTVTSSGSLTLGGTLALTSANVTTALGYTPYNATNPAGYTANVGTVTSVSGTGTVSGLTLTGSITTSGSLTLGGTLALTSGQVTDALGFTPYNASNPSGYLSTVSLTSNVTGTLPIANGGTGATTASGARTALGLGTAAVLNAGVSGGVATLDGSGTVPTSQLPGAVLGGLNYQGTWNASTNTPTLASSTGSKGHYYVVSVAGSTNLDGITDWKIGDWAVYDGSAWQKVDNTDAVSSVNGYTGTVVLTTSDIAQGTNLYFTQAAARGSVSAGTGISYDSGTGVITNSAPDQTVALTGAGTTVVTGTYPNFTITSNDSTVGTVTSVAASGGTTGLSFTGSPIITAGTLTLGGTLALANGGTGATDAPAARANLGAAASGANADITSMTAITGGISSPDFVQFDTAATVTPATGRLYFNDGEGGLAYTLKGGNVVQEVGQSQQVLVYNGTGATLTKGQVVYSNGAQGQRPTVALALATSDATSARTLGIVAESIANGAEGWVTSLGIIENIDTSAFTEGAQLYLSGATAGALTATKPVAPLHMVYVARCIKSNASSGRLFVTVQNGYELDELHDVAAVSPSNGQTIVYNSSTSLWEKNTVSLTAGVNGTLPVANGGTGATTLTGVVVGNGTSAFTTVTAPSGAIVGTTDTQTLSAKTIEGAVLNNGYTEEVFTITDGASVDLDPSNGTIQLWTLGANRSPTATGFATGQSMTLMIDDGTARTITWPSVTWVGGSAPTLETTGYTVVELWKVSTTLYGALVGGVA